MGICDGRVVVITGAGRGLGRSHALAFAREGAKLVVNDLGGAPDGTGASAGPAHDVVDEIRAMGGEAIANADDVGDFEAAAGIITTALDTFGRLDVVVNNAGIRRDRMFVNIVPDEWDATIRVHLRGHFCVGRHAAAYWRDRAKAGEPVDARLINTSSGAGLMGSVGQTAYAAAKAGIAAMTIVQAVELGRYGVTVNGLAPSARTRLTEGVFVDMMKEVDGGFDAMDPDNISPLVVWLGSPESRDVTGRLFEIEGGVLSVCDGWQHGPRIEKDRRWEPSEVGPAIRKLIAQAPPPAPVYGA
ncbi:MAG: SDR family NAD(P)-dependent oxidoreductase [Actinobacteria bacterium]|nr:MAG: SDR family NAD(P)-dependent oxidoreductase [Actinomycetota bacterium]